MKPAKTKVYCKDCVFYVSGYVIYNQICDKCYVFLQMHSPRLGLFDQDYCHAPTNKHYSDTYFQRVEFWKQLPRKKNEKNNCRDFQVKETNSQEQV